MWRIAWTSVIPDSSSREGILYVLAPIAHVLHNIHGSGLQIVNNWDLPVIKRKKKQNCLENATGYVLWHHCLPQSFTCSYFCSYFPCFALFLIFFSLRFIFLHCFSFPLRKPYSWKTTSQFFLFLVSCTREHKGGFFFSRSGVADIGFAQLFTGIKKN